MHEANGAVLDGVLDGVDVQPETELASTAVRYEPDEPPAEDLPAENPPVENSAAEVPAEIPAEGPGDGSPAEVSAEAGEVQPEAVAEVATEGQSEAEANPTEAVPAELVVDPFEEELSRLRNENAMLRYRLHEAAEQQDEIAAFRDAVKFAADELAGAQSKLEREKANVKKLAEEYGQKVGDLRTYLEDIRSGQLRLNFSRPFEIPAAAPAETSAPAAITQNEQPPAEQPGQSPEPQPESASTSAVTADPNNGQVDPNNGQVWGIGVLGQKEILKLVGADEVAAHKQRDEPIGLTEKQLDSLEAQGWTTIAALEKAMREKPLWRKDAGLGEKTTTRVTETLRVWRLHHPHPAE